MRRWAEKFRRDLANKIRRRAAQFGDKWRLDEVVITINGVKHWLWRAVDREEFVLDALVQSRRDRRAAERFLRKLIRKQARTPRVLITDKLASHGAARRDMGMKFEHRQHKGLNNRAETQTFRPSVITGDNHSNLKASVLACLARSRRSKGLGP